MCLTLKIVHGPPSGLKLRVNQETVLVGRGEECDLRLHSNAISRRHCQIAYNDHQLRISDLNSTNGTFVNDRRIDRTELLRAEDIIRVGGFIFTIEPLSDAAHDPHQEEGNEDSGGENSVLAALQWAAEAAAAADAEVGELAQTTLVPESGGSTDALGDFDRTLPQDDWGPPEEERTFMTMERDMSLSLQLLLKVNAYRKRNPKVTWQEVWSELHDLIGFWEQQRPT